jgi:hypothetical protein
VTGGPREGKHLDAGQAGGCCCYRGNPPAGPRPRRLIEERRGSGPPWPKTDCGGSPGLRLGPEPWQFQISRHGLLGLDDRDAQHAGWGLVDAAQDFNSISGRGQDCGPAEQSLASSAAARAQP